MNLKKGEEIAENTLYILTRLNKLFHFDYNTNYLEKIRHDASNHTVPLLPPLTWLSLSGAGREVCPATGDLRTCLGGGDNTFR